MKVLIAGDFCPQSRVAEFIENRDYESVLGGIKDIVSCTDYSIVNFECPVCDGEERPIVKQGPNLQCTKLGLDAVKWVGFNCVTLANNHFLDYGEDGVNYTLSACKELNINAVGGGKNINEAAKILYKRINTETLAVINCCEHEFSIATEHSAGSNPLNPIQQFYAIQEARKNADYVVVIVHGGHEHYSLPSPRMQETYRFFIDAGADAVVNHHQHCHSGYEIYNGKPIFYGLGNFCFDWEGKRDSKWNYGYMVELHLDSNIGFTIYPYEQCNHNPEVKLLQGKQKTEFEDDIRNLNAIIASSSKLKEEHEKWMIKDERNWLISLTPYNNRYIAALMHRKILPLWISKEKIVGLINKVNCESHRDKLLYILNNNINSANG